MVEAFMAAQKGMLGQILQAQQQLVQMLQQQPPLGANPNGPNLVAQIMNSIGKDLEKPQPYASCSPRAPTQGDIDTIADAIKMLEEQNLVLGHIVDTILQDRYQGLSQTSLTNGLSQALFTSVLEQARLCNMLVDHMKKNQLSTPDSLLPPSKQPMDHTKEEGATAARSHINKLPSLKNFCPSFATIVDNPGISPINARTLGRTSHIHRGKAPKQVRVIRTRSQVFKGSKITVISWVLSLLENISLYDLPSFAVCEQPTVDF
jgi:hypothetical protein